MNGMSKAGGIGLLAAVIALGGLVVAGVSEVFAGPTDRTISFVAQVALTIMLVSFFVSIVSTIVWFLESDQSAYRNRQWLTPAHWSSADIIRKLEGRGYVVHHDQATRDEGPGLFAPLKRTYSTCFGGVSRLTLDDYRSSDLIETLEGRGYVVSGTAKSSSLKSPDSYYYNIY